MRFRDIHILPDLFLGLIEDDPRTSRFLLRGSIESVRLRALELLRKSYPQREFADLVSRRSPAHSEGRRFAESIRKLSQPQTVVVLSSWPEQFAGGRLSWFFKCLTAVRLVRELEKTGIEAVPVCWVSPQENGTGEGLTILDSEGRPKVLIPPPALHDSHAVAPPLETFNREIREHAGNIPYPEVLEGIRNAYAAAKNPSDALTNFLLTVFEEQGVIFADGDDPELMALGNRGGRCPGISAHEMERLLAGQEALLRSEGYFVRAVSGLKREEEWSKIPRHWRLEQSIPVAAHVVDEAEATSIALTGPLFDAAEMARPLLWPRSSATLVDARSRKVLDRYRLLPADLAGGAASVVERTGLSETSAETLIRCRQLSRRIDEVLTASSAEAGNDAGVSRLAKEAKSRIAFQIEKISELFAEASRARRETMARQVERVCNVLMPGGRPQELQIAGVYFLLRYSPAILEKIMAQLQIESTEHLMISVE